MKAITIWQPWAALVAVGLKRYETRSWPTKYRGPLLICAAKRRTPSTLVEGSSEVVRKFLKKCNETNLYGKALCVVRLAYCFRTDEVPLYQMASEIDLGDFGPGRYAWNLQDLRVFEKPWPIVGHQGLFEVPDEWIEQHPLVETP